jgi:2-keto-4-pentenoate hydratase/2-oxohepta-3-ene-1,7-dioic acid hydratase in catechol pathway
MKIICVGRNYAEHAAELGDDPPKEPLLFGKFENTLIGDGEAIVLPPEATHVDAEAELALEIGTRGHRIAEDDALDHVRGYRVANDLSARNLQYTDSQWTRAKGFDTFCPLGPAIETEFDVATASLETRLNGEVAQRAPFTDMIHSVADIIAYASAAFTLLPGDVILTGTPAGVGPFVAGDTIEVEISGLGTLRNTARDA